MRSSCKSSSRASIVEFPEVPAAAAASSGSKGSRATAAPSNIRRAVWDSNANSSVRAAAQCAEQLDRCGVGPVDVVEQEHQGRGQGELLQELAYGPMAAIALVLERHLVAFGERRERRKDMS